MAARHLLVIEGKFFRALLCIHKDELGTAFDGARIPKVIGIADPVDRAGRVYDQIACFGLKLLPALKICQRSLRP